MMVLSSSYLNKIGLNRNALILLVLSLVLLMSAYWGGLEELVVRWNKQEEYGHGYFIPFLTAWFLWNRKEAIVAGIGKGHFLGVILIAISAIGLVLGEITALYLIIQLGFIVSLMGLVLAFGGGRLLKVCFVPILFLIFCIPLPYFLEALLTARLQIMSSEIGVAILRGLGTTVYLEGNLIDLGQYRLQVIEACSGLRYLYPLMGISFLMAYMYQAKFWKQALIFISSIPITVFMNSARIAMVGILVDNWGNEMADGFLHYFEGWIVFMLCLAILILEVWVFEFFGQKRKVMLAIDLPKIPVINASVKNSSSNLPLMISVALLLVLNVVVSINNNRVELHPNRKALSTYPLSLNGWKGVESSLSKPELELLALDDYILADYKKDNINNHVNFYVAYYASQRKGVSPHSPQVCMPGGGWMITSLNKLNITGGDGKHFQANRVIIQKSDQRQLVYYWFEQRGRRIASEYWMKWYLFKDAIFMNRTDGALVRIVTPSPLDEPIDQADKRIEDFISSAMPTLNEYVPN